MVAVSIDGSDGPSPGTAWWVQHETEAYGPYAEEQMRTYVVEGRIVAETPVRRDDEADWCPASEHPLFGPVFHQVTRSVAAPPLPEQTREEAPDLTGTAGGPSARLVGPAGIPASDFGLSDLPQGESPTLAHVVYGLYVLSLFTGVAGIVGVVIAYLKRRDVQDTWLASHYQWQIRTFWIGLLFAIIAGLLLKFVVGWVLFGVLYLWYLWRIVKGWVRLGSSRPIDNPTSWTL